MWNKNCLLWQDDESMYWLRSPPFPYHPDRFFQRSPKLGSLNLGCACVCLYGKRSKIKIMGASWHQENQFLPTPTFKTETFLGFSCSGKTERILPSPWPPWHARIAGLLKSHFLSYILMEKLRYALIIYAFLKKNTCYWKLCQSRLKIGIGTGSHEASKIERYFQNRGFLVLHRDSLSICYTWARI